MKTLVDLVNFSRFSFKLIGLFFSFLLHDLKRCETDIAATSKKTAIHFMFNSINTYLLIYFLQ